MKKKAPALQHVNEPLLQSLPPEQVVQCPRTFYTDLDTLICKIRKMTCSGWSMPGI